MPEFSLSISHFFFANQFHVISFSEDEEEEEAFLNEAFDGIKFRTKSRHGSGEENGSIGKFFFSKVKLFFFFLIILTTFELSRQKLETKLFKNAIFQGIQNIK